MFPVWYLDYPDVCKDNPDPEEFAVKGWIASPAEIGNIRFSDANISGILPVSTYLRPDVTEVYGLPATGFEASCSFELVRENSYLELAFEAGEQQFEIIVPVHSGNVDVLENKKNKLERIRPLLACPQCRSGELIDHKTSLECSKCGQSFPSNEAGYDFLTSLFKESFDVDPTENVSFNSYDGTSLNLIHKHSDGLILDCGAGLRQNYYANVVNYEIVAYSSTDVLGVGEKLPFKDNVFDAVFSFAVLEHVEDPSVCVKELVRVLKPGGTVYCNVPFLQPLHGYPHHYFNMTQRALLALFEDYIETDRIEVLNFGQPIFALSWFLNSYIAGLPEEVAAEFRKMTVADLLKPGNAYLGEQFVSALSDKVQEELACCNLLVGRKKS